MTLKKYHEKRDFTRTPEPYGKENKKQQHYSYLIQKHAASHLHYDFRIELDGVLKSWAVPKGPSLDPTIKRLAVHVEDHPIAYGSFEGIIPKGQYGGGTVMLWDQGAWEPTDKDPRKAYQQGNLTIKLKGKKLKGLWKLVQIKSDPKNWLLMKLDDKYAKPEKEFNVTEAKPLSAATRRTMSAIAKNPAREWQSNKANSATKSISKKKVQKNLNSPKISSGLDRMPKEIFPELATLVSQAPAGDQWLHEMKLDGYRLICFVNGDKIRLVTRGQQNWTDKFPNVFAAIKKLKLDTAILDGEIVAFDEKQRSNFQLLQNTIHFADDKALTYYLFDLLYLHGNNLMNKTLLYRKEILKNILSKNKNTMIQYSDHIVGEGQKIWKQACALQMEGIVSKNIHSTYAQTRTKDWVKVKCVKRQEFIVCGYTKPTGARNHFGSLLLGVYERDKLIYCGHVGTGFTETSLHNMNELLKKYKTDVMPFVKRPPLSKHAGWVKPCIIVEVEFSEWTGDHILRHPSFKGIRKDKLPREVTMEKPKKIAKAKRIPNSLKQSAHTQDLPIVLTNPDKILYPQQGITKIQLAEYYTEIQDWILPYIVKRPLTLVRCPDGTKKNCFYQKHLTEQSFGPLYTIPIQEKEAEGDYIYIKDLEGLLTLVQMRVLEIHPWGCRVDSIEKPDMIIFDLDPAPDVEWKRVIKAALLVKEQLEAIGLVSFVKTTGGKGLHVVVPIKRFHDWDAVKAFAKAFVTYLVEQYPDQYVSVMTKSKRPGKIFIDYLRNGRGATAVAAYSTRAKPAATVATPLAWSELTSRIHSDTFTVLNLPKRLAKLSKDPWEDFFKIKQSLKLPK